MTTATHNVDSLEKQQALLRERLARLRRRLRSEMMLELALDVSTVAVATGTLLVLLDWWFRLGVTARLILLLAALSAVIPFCVIRARRRSRACRLDDLSLAMTLDRFRPGIGGRIADVLQLPDLLRESSEAVSPVLVRVAVRDAVRALDASDWTSLWNRGRTVNCIGLLGLALLLPTFFAVAAPDATRLSLARWLLGSSERWPQRTYLVVSGLGDANRLVAPRGEPFALEVRADLPRERTKRGWVVRGRGAPLVLGERPRWPQLPSAVRIRERSARGEKRDAVMVATGPATFRYELPPSTTSTTIELAGGDDWLGPIRVERVDRPALTSAKLRVHEPGTPAGTFRNVEEGVQHPVFLPDTEIQLTLTGSEPIADAHLTVHPGEPPKLDRADPRSFAANWTLREATTLEVELTSRATGLTSKPTFLSIGLLKDREPRLSLRALGVGGHVTPVATIPLSIAATDDFGLAAVRLHVDRTTTTDDKSEPKTSRKTVPLPLPGGAGRAVLDHQARHDVELQAEPPAIGTLLRFVAEADDRCARGTQVGRSAVLHLQVVAPDELFYEILIRQRAERAKFVSVLETAEKRAPVLDGTPTRENYAEVMRSLHSGSRQVDLIAGRIADTLQEMKLNQVGSPKSHRLLQEGVIDPIRALNTGPVNELRGVLQTLAGSGPKSGADPETARRLHREIVARMKTILDQMSQWESFVDVVNQLAEVIKMQQGVLQAAEQARESRTKEVFDEKP